MIEFKRYPTVFPNLPIELVLYFELETENGKMKEKRIIDFISHYSTKYSLPEGPQPNPISRICNTLVKYGKMSVLAQGGLDNLDNSYLTHITNKDDFLYHFNKYNEQLSCIAYGFSYMYEAFKKYVVPIKYITHNFDETIGTGFFFLGGIATAKHCLEGARDLSIKGISKEELNSSEILIHENKDMDIAIYKATKQSRRFFEFF